MASSAYYDWKAAAKKGDLKFYANEEFRRDYTLMEMDRKATIFMERALPDVTAVLSDISGTTDRDEIRILSLGCGPGSDLLGILRAVDSVLRSGDSGLRWEAGQLKCCCTGVDVFDWNQDAFAQRISQFHNGFGQIRFRFVQEKMFDFVSRCLQDDGVSKFDFICLSFANAGRNLGLIGRDLPPLLSEFGRILVLDNDTRMVRNLAVYGFACTSAQSQIVMFSVNRGTGMANRRIELPENPTMAETMEYLLRVYSWEVMGGDD